MVTGPLNYLGRFGLREQTVLTTAVCPFDDELAKFSWDIGRSSLILATVHLRFEKADDMLKVLE